MSKLSVLKEKIKNSQILLIFAVAVFFIVPMAASAQTVSLSPNSITAGQNQQFNIDVNVSGASNLFTIGFDLLFDPALLQFVSATDGGFLSQGGVAILLLVNENPRGDLVFSNARLGAYNGGVSGAGTSAHLTFKTLAQDGQTALAFSGGSLCVLVNGSCSYASGSWNNGGVTISTPDTTPPTAPTGLTAAAVSATQINLSWSASTDPSTGSGQVSGVAGYRITRNGAVINQNVNATTYQDTGLNPSTNYSYTVVAFDAAGNYSQNSNVASAATPALPDTAAPAVAITSPTTNATYTVSNSSLNLAGTASDNVGVSQVSWINGRGGSGIAVGTTAWTITNINLQPGDNLITIAARDAAGNIGYDTITVIYNPPDTTPPAITITAPTANSTYATANGTINISGTASDNIGVTQIIWSVSTDGSGAAIGTANWSVSNIPLLAGTNVITVTARDAAGNSASDTLTVTYTPADTTAPSVPTGLTATAVSGSQINLNWNASTDPSTSSGQVNGVAGYKIYRDGVYLTTVSSTNFQNTGLTPATGYGYQVSAVDASGNESPKCATVSAVTQALPDTTPPSAPANLTVVSVTASQINLSWTASSDNVGVAGYRVYRDNVYMMTVTLSAYYNAGLPSGTTYSYQVSAIDAAGNESARTAAVSATTLQLSDAQPPTAPSNLRGTVFNYQVNLSWYGSRDPSTGSGQVSGLAGYKVYRDNKNLGTTNQTSYNDRSLTPGAIYQYNVSAYDATGNESAKSNTLQLAVLTGSDRVKPSTPGGFKKKNITSTEIQFYWPASTDPSTGSGQASGVTGYRIFRNNQYLTTVSQAEFNDANLKSKTTYTYRVSAIDAAGNESYQSSMVSFTTLLPPDTFAPSAPANLRVSYNLYYYPRDVRLYWYGSRDDRPGKIYYNVYRNGDFIGSTTWTSFYNKLSNYGVYSYQVRAVDAAGNLSGPTSAVSANYSKDETPPPAPTNLRVNYNLYYYPRDARLYWYGVRDERPGRVYYRLYRNGSFLASTTATSYLNKLSDYGVYNYQVRAVDATGNESAPSNSASVNYAPDTTPPPAPSNLHVYQDWRDKSLVRAYWYGIRDERPGAVRYNVYRNDSKISTINSTGFSEKLTDKGSFRYRVAAIDIAGNESARSAAVTISW